MIGIVKDGLRKTTGRIGSLALEAPRVRLQSGLAKRYNPQIWFRSGYIRRAGLASGLGKVCPDIRADK